MTDAAPLQPPAPQSVFALEAPAPVAPVATTAAPAMAPQIDEAALPGLDAKVDAYVDGLMAAQIGSPELAAQGRRHPPHGRLRHPRRRGHVEPAAPDARQGAARGRRLRHVAGQQVAAGPAQDGREPRPQRGHASARSCSGSSRSATR